MIIYENHGQNALGVELTRAFSDKEVYIISDESGAKYEEAIDPTALHRTYTESDEPIENEDEATVEDYEAALGELGVEL